MSQGSYSLKKTSGSQEFEDGKRFVATIIFFNFTQMETPYRKIVRSECSATN